MKNFCKYYVFALLFLIFAGCKMPDNKGKIVVTNQADQGITEITAQSVNGIAYIVSVGEGNTKTVSVSVKNASSPVLDEYTWISSNPAIVDVSSSGSTAVFTGNGIGIANIIVKNKACYYPLTIFAQCVDPIAASANTYIQLSPSFLTLNVSSNYTSVTADLIGGTSDDYSDFIWDVEDKSVCAVYGQ